MPQPAAAAFPRIPRAFRALSEALLTLLIASAAALAVRYALIERDDLGPICDAASAPWWCALRMALIEAFLNDVFGRASVALAALALWRGSRLAAHSGLAVGACGMVLYNFTWAGAGVLGSAMALARLQGEWREHRDAEQGTR